MRKQWFVLLVAVFASIALWGCGSGGGSGDSADVTTVDDIAAVGIANCSTCHDAETADWLASSAHGNSNEVPDLSYFGSDPANCSTCHDPSGEGENLRTAFLNESNRPAVGCEECHGGGSAHRGVGPIPYAWPDAAQCASCHDGAHGDYDLATAVENSAHNNSDDLHASTTRCQRCHTTEGSILLSQFTGDADVMHLMDDLAPIAAEEDLHPVTCAACHKTHTDELRADSFIVNDNSLAAGNWDPNGNGTADQFDFCTSCHSYYNQDGVLIGSGSDASGTAPFYHNTAWYRTLTTTHFDNPATTDSIEGYVVRAESANPCFDCHDHEFRTNTRNADQPVDPADADMGSTIHSQWATSAHGGFLLDQVRTAAEAVDCTGSPSESRGRCEEIVDAAMAAAVTDAEAAAWTHYDWDAENRQACQRCHTATGGMNYLNDPATYDAANNDFSHLEGWMVNGDGSITSSGQNEMLYCWGCHSDTRGGLRNPGTVALEFPVDGVNPTLPDLGKTNTCVSCHLGRGNMDSLGTPVDPFDTAPATTATKTHYFNGAATVFAAQVKPGFEYATRSYDGPVFFAHDSVGLTGASPEAGGGPCVTCHMQSAEGHTFEVVAKDDSGVITGLNSTACIECHDGEHGPALVTEDTTTAFGDFTAAAAAAFLEEEAEGYHEALDILQVALADHGSFFAASYPYFFVDTNDNGVLEDSEISFPNGFLTWENSGHLGAAHNFNYLHHEPGAYAHNRFYAKRLIYDSIDWLDNGQLDESVVIDLVTYPGAAHWLGADATTGAAARP